MTTTARLFFVFLFTVFFTTTTSAQNEMLKMLDSSHASDHVPVIASFKSTRLVNLSTIESLGKRTLDFRIAHRFGSSQGIDNFFGLDGPAAIKLSLEYSYDGRLMAGIGRTNINKVVDGFLKYRLLRQTEDNFIPVSVSLFSGAYITVQKDLKINYPKYDNVLHRFSFVHQVMIARKFNERLTLQFSPTLIHYNVVEHTADKNDVIALGFLGRYKFTHRTAFTTEYSYTFPNFLSSAKERAQYHNMLSLGFDIETGGHVFQIFISNASAVDEMQAMPFTKGQWFEKTADNKIKPFSSILLGFNISRVFTL